MGTANYILKNNIKTRFYGFKIKNVLEFKKGAFICASFKARKNNACLSGACVLLEGTLIQPRQKHMQYCGIENLNKTNNICGTTFFNTLLLSLKTRRLYR